MQAVTENRFVEWEEVYKGTCYGTLRSEVERIWAKGTCDRLRRGRGRRHQPQAHLRRRRLLGVRHAALGRGAAPTARRPRHGRPGGDRPPRGEGRIRTDESPRVRPRGGQRLRSTRPCARPRAASSTNSSHGRMKRVMLYFGSFNPVHRGHIALAEYVVGAGSLRRGRAGRFAPKPLQTGRGSWLPKWTVSKWPRSPAPLRNTRIASNLRSWNFCCRNPHTQ